jgi:beta-lactamase regulating signal transducer with metallopeptidase domain
MIESLLFAILANGILVAALTPVLWLASKCIRSAPLRHALWLVLLVKLVTPPLVSVPLFDRPADSTARIVAVERVARPLPVALPSSPQPTSPVLPQGDTPSERPSNLTTFLSLGNIGRVLACVWLTGSVVWYGFALTRLLRFARLTARCTAAPEAWQADVRRLALRLGLRKVPEVRLVAGSVPPLLWAVYRRPMIVLSEGLAAQLSRQERWMLLAHELAHLARGDHWTRRLELLVLGLYWWHPSAWLACRKLREAEEECCDAYIAWLWPHASQVYAHLLLNTLDFLATDAALPIGVSGFASASTFRARFAMILQGRSSRRLTLRAKLAVAAAALPLLLTSVAGGGEAPPKSKPANSRSAAPLTIPAETSKPVNIAATVANVEIIAAKPGEGPIDYQAAEFGLVSCAAAELPLREVLKQISDGEEPTTLVVHLDDTAKCGVSLGRKVTLHVERISRQSALNLVLRPLGLQHESIEGRIHIVARFGQPRGIWCTQDHYIRDFTDSRWSQPEGARAVYSLIELIETTIDPSSWQDADFVDPSLVHPQRGSIAITREGHYLTITQSSHAQMKINEFLTQLRKNRQLLDQPRTDAFIHFVRDRADWRFVNTPLEEVVKQLSSHYDVNIFLDDDQLRAAQLTRKTPVSLHTNNAKFEDALPLLLGPLELSYTFEDEVLKIVSRGYTIPIVTRVYDVYDLVNPTRRSGDERMVANLQPLVDQIKSEVTSDSWNGYASISIFQNNLSVVISHNEAGHRAVNSYLKRLRQAKFGGGESSK